METAETNAKKILGDFFREARLDVDLTQAVVAEEIGVSLSRLKQFEIGRVMPRLTIAYQLLSFYDVDWDELGGVLEHLLFPDESDDTEASTPLPNSSMASGHAGRVTNRSRSETRMKGQHIVMSWLEKHGWDTTPKNQPNYDILAEKSGSTFKFKITTKNHKSKTTLCNEWTKNEPSFNQIDDQEKADFLVMVRFTNTEEECFLLTINEAEEKANWLAKKVIEIGNKPMFLQAYVGGPRNSKYYFNTREVWQVYADNWINLGFYFDEDVEVSTQPEKHILPIPTDAPFTSLIINVPIERATPPARPGTDRYKRFCILRTLNGKTIQEYYKACRKADLACQKNNPVLAHEKGFIILTSPNTEYQPNE